MNHDISLAVVVIAYNRPHSLLRLLQSIKNAKHLDLLSSLIISIDKSDSDEVFNVASSFDWPFDNLKIIHHQENLGLRQHVLMCGDLVKDYDALIMLEDDLVVSQEFLRYAKEAVEFYREDPRIAGISLYNNDITEFAEQRPFYPLHDGYDNYFASVPSSWGQIWTQGQWLGFRAWYDNKSWENIDDIDLKVPQNVLLWKKSWKKFFYLYIACANKFIVYPRFALSTNMGDAGVHSRTKYNAYQSELQYCFNRDYLFSTLDSSSAIYDEFLENIQLGASIYEDTDLTEICISYYGNKDYIKLGKKYLLSPKVLDYRIERQWALELIPYELNILYDIQGKGLFLYDISEPQKNAHNSRASEIHLVKYENRSMNHQKIVLLFIDLIRYKVRRINEKLILRRG